MRLLSSNEVKKHELMILLDVQDFCEKINICFYILGGTLLGAIRHHGFIPWDDDIDICMPRPDYERFLQTYKSAHGYIPMANILGNWVNPFAKVIDPNTKVVSYISDNEPGLWIDIFPVDGLPDNFDHAKKLYDKCEIYRSLFSCVFSKLGEGKTRLRKYAKYILKPIALMIGAPYLSKKVEELAHTCRYEDSKYVGVITWGLHGIGERMPKDEFERKVMVDFEGYKMPTFSCWDLYLGNLYGNYMQLPPENQRYTHSMDVYVKD